MTILAKRRGGLPLRRLVAIAAPILITAALAGAAPASATGQVTRVSGAAAGTSIHTVSAHDGLGTASGPVTLITGDQVQMTPTTGGPVTVSANPARRADGAEPSIQFTAVSKPGATASVEAAPADAQALIAAGLVDRNLFNVGYLAVAEKQGGTLPVMVQYAGHPSASALTDRAGRLPGASVKATQATQGSAEVEVSIKKASQFWAALTGEASTSREASAPGASVTRLTGDISKVWLGGHQPTTRETAAQAAAATGGPLQYTVTVIIKAPAVFDPLPEPCTSGFSGATASQPSRSFCFSNLGIVAVAGAGTEQALFPFLPSTFTQTSTSCLDPPACNTLEAKFSVPPGVYSTEGDNVTFDKNSRTESAQLIDPQFIVAGDTTIEFDLAKAKPIIINTPRPSSVFNESFGDVRTLANGVTASSAIVSAGYPQPDLMVDLAQNAAAPTIGTYAFSDTTMLGQPPVTMSVPGSRSLSLTPSYPQYSNLAGPIARFSGQSTAGIVDGGDGTNLSGLDVNGKLVLIHLEPNSQTANCELFTNQVTPALQAGAAGVVLDPATPPGTDPSRFPGGVCAESQNLAGGLSEEWNTQGQAPPGIPFVVIPHSQADTLHQMLAHGSVNVTVTDNGESPYLYELSPHIQGIGPASLTYNVTSHQLETIITNYHAGAGRNPNQTPVNYAGITTDSGAISVVGAAQVQTPADFTRQEYVEVSSDLVQERTLNPGDLDFEADELRVFNDPGAVMTEDYGEPPAAIGAPEVPNDAFQALPGFYNPPSTVVGAFADCVFCRQGDTLYPIFIKIFGGSPRSRNFPNSGLAFEPGQIHLFEGNQEIPPSTNIGIVTYTLPAQQARYTLTADDGPDVVGPGAPAGQITWDFTSAEPTADTRPTGTICDGDIFSFPNPAPPCQAVPLVLLRYNAELSLANTVTAPGTHQIQITACHQGPDAPAIKSLQAWTSTDGGTTWQPATVAGGKDGVFTATYTLPAGGTTVSLKVHASDAGGNDVTQIMDDAFSAVAK